MFHTSCTWEDGQGRARIACAVKYLCHLGVLAGGGRLGQQRVLAAGINNAMDAADPSGQRINVAVRSKA